MAKFQVIFNDSVHGTQIAQFDTFNDAAEYWQTYAEVDTCYAGWLEDLENNEIIWEFSEG